MYLSQAITCNSEDAYMPGDLNSTLLEGKYVGVSSLSVALDAAGLSLDQLAASVPCRTNPTRLKDCRGLLKKIHCVHVFAVVRKRAFIRLGCLGDYLDKVPLPDI